MKHALTVDVEDWYSGIPLNGSSIGESDRRLRRSMNALLSILEQYGTKATFFWLGELAEQYPDLVREVADSGHETGCHDWTHEFIYKKTPAILKRDMSRSKFTLEDISGTEVRSYRAPFFSIRRESLCMLETISEAGFSIDSSIFPIINWRYGIPGFPDDIRRIATGNGPLWLAPVSIRRIAGVAFPVSGGAYFRIYPYLISSLNMKAMQKAGRPCVFYIHPWELDPDHPRVHFSPLARATHYVKLQSCMGKFQRLLSDYDFQPLGCVVDRFLRNATKNS